MIYPKRTKPISKIIYFIVLLLMTCSSSYAQNVVLNTQSEVDAFYPGTIYNGNITIGRDGGGQASDITNLFNFSVLEKVNGTLSIKNNPQLTNVDELINLSAIEGTLFISYNSKLNNVNGFINLKSISVDLFLQNNDMLNNIDGFDNVSEVEAININHNDMLTKIDGFSNVETISSIVVQNGNNLIEISGFERLEIINSILITRNSSLVNFSGFPKLESLPGGLTFNNNDKLINLEGVSSITSLKHLNISTNNSLESLDQFSNLLYVGGNINIETNSSLTDCCAIQELLSEPNAVGGIVNINDNPSECSSQTEIVENYCGLKFKVFENPPCINEANGSIQVNVTNYDTIPFYYQLTRQEDGLVISGTSFDSYFSIEMLEAGTYDLVVSTPKPDSAFKYDIALIPINGSYFEIVEVTTTNSSNGLNNGAIQLIVSGSSPPYDIEWTGSESGNISGYASDTIIIPFIPYGEYNINITDSNGVKNEISLTLLDEIVPTFPCTQPLDIIILNDVSGSVDSIEYLESKDFFIDFLSAANVGLDTDETRACIVEWSNEDQQDLKVPITGDMNSLSAYKTMNRSFDEGTIIHDAMLFGESYLESVARPDVVRVLILATDGVRSQVPPSLEALADQLKANGYHILTIAFDNAFNDVVARDILYRMASVGQLAPGAPAYSQLDNNLAENIVNTYLCPIDPGSSSNVYFSRDGAIEINELDPIANCINPKFVDVTFTVAAFRELSIPGGTYITFYLNDPEQFGATKLLSWQIPCSIAPDASETFTVTLPINGPSHIFAALNDDGTTGNPINFPITDIEEIAYSNNIDNEWICVGDNPTLQAIKYSTTPTASCDTIVKYTINVCNISEEDAIGVIVTDQAPDDFVLVNTVSNLNGCATETSGIYNIPEGCCISLNLTYDASAATLGYYGNQGVILDGPDNQEYYGYDGSSSTAEDVILDGTIDCPSTIVEFTKEVSMTQTCDDAFLTFTFTINNELNYPLQGLTFSDIVSAPSTWIFEPYNLSGLSIGSKSINQNIAEFIIDEVEANTVASFSMDLSLNFWENYGTLLNIATLDNVPDAENGGVKTLISNSTSTDISPTLPPSLPDSIFVQVVGDTLNFDLWIDSLAFVSFTTEGDGAFWDFNYPSIEYVLGTQDKVNGYVVISIILNSECYDTVEEVVIILQECELKLEIFDVSSCHDNDTPIDPADDFYTVDFNFTVQHGSSNAQYFVIIENDTLGIYSYGSDESIVLPADGVDRVITFVDNQYEDCILFEVVNVENCSVECELDLVQLLVTDCDDSDTPDDTSDDSYSINFIIDSAFPGIDSSYYVIIGNDTLSGYSYNEEQLITLTASSNIDEIQFIDSEFESCFIAVNVGVESCIYPCELFIEEFTISECDDNETPEDDSDDTFTVTFDLSSSYPGIDSTYFLIFDLDTIGEYVYNSEQTISFQADGVDHIFDFVDSYNSECILSELVNVESCSNPCDLVVEQLIIADCYDNETLSDNSDDTFEISFVISASYPGLDSMYFVIIGNDTIGAFAYGSEETFSFSADGLERVIMFVDSQIEGCQLIESVLVDDCSSLCAIVEESFAIAECNNNGTENDDTDDMFALTFEMSASNPSFDSTYFLIVGLDTIGQFKYDSSHSITLPTYSLDYIIRFSDTQNEDCLITKIIRVESCSDACELFIENFIVSDCDDGGTSDVLEDDFYEIAFNISANYPYLDSVYNLFRGDELLGTFSYDTDYTLNFAANGFEDNIHFIDSEFEYCLKSENITLNYCSEIGEEPVLEDIIIPNVFSPNDDGINDDWTIEIFTNVQILSCDIYDRWGNLIYKSDAGKIPVWDGSFNEESLNPGVYVYKLLYSNTVGESMIRYGDITILK